jgi:transcriptional regulator with XRE-family HTH domain
MVNGMNVTALRDRLATALRHFRFDANLTQVEVANNLNWSVSKVVRQEAGATTPSVTDVRALLCCCGVTDPAVVDKYGDLARMIRASRQRNDAAAPAGSTGDRRRLLRAAETLGAVVADLTLMAGD